MAKQKEESVQLTPEQQQAIDQAVTQPPTSQPTSYNRRQRRHMMKQQGVLKYLSNMNFLGEVRSNFRKQNIENGRKIRSAKFRCYG